ncbi:hypothetical protein [Salinibacterium sp.]|uniref:hypothetical protein n=1 Tax=Salinibacterium sp. TaxID=1915057 RepID=UPI00286B4959|nr:hypothetical protein [Salinibacterium sp.]
MMKFRIALPVAGILVILGLAGCLPSSPQSLPTPLTATAAEVSTPTASPDPMPTVTPDPVVTAALIVDADSIAVVGSGGSAQADILFTTPVATAVEQLSNFLGADPIVADVPQRGECSAAHTTFDWEGLRLQGADQPRGSEFEISVRAPATVGGVSLQFSDGLQVGSSVSDLIASPSVQSSYSSNIYYFDVRGDLTDNSAGSDPYGGSVAIEAGAVLVFSAPRYYFYGC